MAFQAGVYDGYVSEPPRKIRVVDSVDVLVVGGGPAGVGACLAAARLGVRTAVVDQFSYLGGMWTAGLVNPILDHANKGGIMAEIVQSLRKSGATTESEQHHETFDNEYTKYLLDNLCAQAGVELKLHRYAVDTILDGDKVVGIVTESKSGREAILARQVIDCTGDGDVCAFAGVPYELGRPGDHLMQPMTLFQMMSELPQENAPPEKVLAQMQAVVGADDSYEFCYLRPSLFRLPQPGIGLMQYSHLYGYDGTSADDLTKAAVAARRQIHEMMAILNKTPLFVNAKLVSTAAMVGVRETRHIQGRYLLTEEDLLAGRTFSDGICSVQFNIDIHTKPGSTDPLEYGRKVPLYQIPYRALLPVDKENLLMAGRCISGTSRAHASFRATGDCVAMGQAVGTAAALSIHRGISPSQLAAEELLTVLRDNGVKI